MSKKKNRKKALRHKLGFKAPKEVVSLGQLVLNKALVLEVLRRLLTLGHAHLKIA